MTIQPSKSNWLSIFALGLIWGGTFMVVSIALEGYGPLTVATARTTLGSLALIGIMVAMRSPIPQFSAPLIKYLLVIGVMNTALPFAMLSWGQQYVPSAFAGISMAAIPLFVLPLSHLFSDEVMTKRNLTGVTLGFIGAVVLIGPSVLRIGSGWEPLGQLACVAAALSYAISSVMTRRCPPIDSITMATILMIIGMITLIPAMLIVEGIPVIADTRSTLAIIFLGFVPTALAALLRVFTIRSAGAVFMTLVNYQVPVWSMIFGAIVLSETLPLRFFAALALILIGLAISQFNSLKRLWS
ncbi:drug/metabolite transporter (DMT)-like permease [Loktanella ponticola]|uniref:Drug/metabolite transporter (DMT)-like permease n=1 Tax=Yoonia ponticola TaxID=1524255 RepID=A0A7W9BMN0_9RHOB|nr:drug/metabolite transporter (DMT)-like permease [Yoonia ponticola]